MTTSPAFSDALAELSDSISSFGRGVLSVAQTAQQAQSVAEDAIPKSQAGIDPGDVVVLDQNGRLPAVDGSLLTNLPTLHATLPVLTIELGHSQQANGGRGIDMGDWYQLDFRIGVTTNNDFEYTENDDGTITLASGVYLVCGSAKIIATSTDTYAFPAQMIFAAGQEYSFPGIYQYAVQRYPDTPVSNIATSGLLGSLGVSGVQANWGSGNPLWMGFAKVSGSQNQVPLALQGYMSIVKIG